MNKSDFPGLPQIIPTCGDHGHSGLVGIRDWRIEEGVGFPERIHSMCRPVLSLSASRLGIRTVKERLPPVRLAVLPADHI